MIIHSGLLTEDGGDARLQATLETASSSEVLWYSFPARYSEFTLPERLDSFLVGSLLLAMRRGEDIHVRGPVSERLFYHLHQHFMPIAALNNPALEVVRVTADQLESGLEGQRPTGVAAGFSGGVDSFCAVHDHINAHTPQGFKLTHLIFNNVGSHGEFDTVAARKLFNLRYDLIKGFPGTVGLDLIKVDSNVSDILQMVFQQTHIPRSISCPLLFPLLLRRYYYAASIHYRDLKLIPRKDMCATEAASLHLLSTESLECILTGGQFTRVEKTRRAGLVPGSEKFLNVCVAPLADGGNCSVCKKCARTLITLEVLGRIQDFDGVFDLDRWREYRTFYLIKTVLSRPKRILISEIHGHAAETGYRFPLWQWVAGRIFGLIPQGKDRWVQRLRERLRRVKRRLGA